MSANTYIETFGIALVYGTAGGSPATAVAGIKKVKELPAQLMKFFETTRMDQASRAEQFAPSTYDPGKIGLEIAMSKTDYATLLAVQAAGTEKSWKITLSQAFTDQADGYIEKMQMLSEDKGEITVDFAVRLSGARTFTA